jgi:predicted RNase H-like HicB family nuclease
MADWKHRRMVGENINKEGPVMRHEVIVTRDEEGWIVAECPELPGCVSQGKTEAEALANIREAMAGWLWAEEQKAAELLR